MIQNLFRSPYSSQSDSLRFHAFVGYCLFHIAYNIFLFIYAIINPEHRALLYAAIFTSPYMIAAIFFARKNYKVTAKVFVILSFLAQAGYLFGLVFSQELNIIALNVYLMIAILAFAVINKTWGISIFVLGVLCLALNFLLDDYGFKKREIKTHDIDMVFYHVSAYTTCIFAFVCYLLHLFEKYMRLYLAELTTSKTLYTRLEGSVDLLNDLNHNLEEHVSALSDANSKLSRYAWTQSHEVRAPVARILGLLNLVKIDENLDKDFFTVKLLDTAKELDEVILKTNSILEDVDIEESMNDNAETDESRL